MEIVLGFLHAVIWFVALAPDLDLLLVPVDSSIGPLVTTRGISCDVYVPGLVSLNHDLRTLYSHMVNHNTCTSKSVAC